MMKPALLFVLATASTAALVVPVSSQQPTATSSCSVAALQARAPSDTTIAAAAVVEPARSTPRHCRVDGQVAVPGNRVNFRVGLPEAWNGKFYFQGVGGLGGSIGSLDSGLARGYATASTDTGHQASESGWTADRAKEIDYGHRGTHVTAVAAKALTGAYYGRAAAHAYFNGCSNGGRQALMEVQRYPQDFDGVIAGDPAIGTPMQVARALVYQHMLASEANYLTPEKVELISRSTLAACDATDGLKDGLITDPRACRFDPASLQCPAGSDGAQCLTPGQVETARRVYEGVKLPDGTQYAPGFPVGHEGGTSGWPSWITGRTAPTPGPDGMLAFGASPPSGFRLSDENMRVLALEQDDPQYSWKTLRFPQDLPRLRVMSEILSPLDPDLRPFRKHGGKLIMYHGWADPAISAYGTVNYFDAATRTAGGPQDADAFMRLYLAPGMHHCRGGDGPDTFDFLPVLEAWVEKNVAPGPVVASQSEEGKVIRTRPLCPHPQVARYTGNGSIDDAASFRCVAGMR